MAKYLVCVSDERHASYEIERAILEKAGAELKLCHCESAADIAAQCADADAVLLDLAPMTAEAVAGLRKCKVISRYGVGFENVDLDAATAAGIQVTNVPDYCMEDVSDHALALMLSCLRHIPLRDREVREEMEHSDRQLPAEGQNARCHRRRPHRARADPQGQRLRFCRGRGIRSLYQRRAVG